MRLMSFSLTTPQFLAGTKTVTRRMGWRNLKAGQRLQAIEKGQGLKKGEKVRRLGLIEVIDVRREKLSAITAEDCKREGFPDLQPAQFVLFYGHATGCKPWELVTRIEFRRIP